MMTGWRVLRVLQLDLMVVSECAGMKVCGELTIEPVKFDGGRAC